MTLVRLELTTFSLEGKRTIQLYNKALECPQPDLNRRPTHYKCVALPLRHRDIVDGRIRTYAGRAQFLSREPT